MIYSPEDVRRILNNVYKAFVGRLSDGEDSLYAKLLRKAIAEVEKKV